MKPSKAEQLSKVSLNLGLAAFPYFFPDSNDLEFGIEYWEFEASAFFNFRCSPLTSYFCELTQSTSFPQQSTGYAPEFDDNTGCFWIKSNRAKTYRQKLFVDKIKMAKFGLKVGKSVILCELVQN